MDTERIPRMDAERVLSIVLREMRSYGNGWRADWSYFDGRSLRDQLNSLADWAIKAQKDPELDEYERGSEFLGQQLGG